MGIRVKRVRVLRNMALLAALSLGLLWLGRNGLPGHAGPLALGLLAGLAAGAGYWWRLRHRIERRNRQYARNRIFVRFISPLEFILAAAATSHLLLLVVPGLLLVMLLAGLATGHGWTLFLGSLGLGGAGAVSLAVLRYERRHGPLYYQYASAGWGGGESLLYQTGTVVEALEPEGRIRIEGALWRARSLDGEAIAAGETVEVLDREGLVLQVTRTAARDE